MADAGAAAATTGAVVAIRSAPSIALLRMEFPPFKWSGSRFSGNRQDASEPMDFDRGRSIKGRGIEEELSFALYSMKSLAKLSPSP
ncbi:hypothetical protein GCM10010276_70860 [Streptomyces longisporus]|uniref:Uncharacterized protein n=1 Tax=Streptomyces longisporus TaxID=1948 RepID=A0ABP6AGH7_STRLO